MRSIKLTTAVAASAALLTLAPAFASAAGRHHARLRSASGCHLSLSVAPRLLTAGGKVTATGLLKCGQGSVVEGQAVTLYQGSVTTPGYTADGTGTTEKSGEYKIETPTPLTTNSRFYAVADGAQSADRNVKVLPLVELNGPAEGQQLLAGLRTGHRNRVTFTGTVSPADIGALVVLQRQNALTGNEWHRIGSGRVVAGSNPSQGSFSIVHQFVVPGDADIRAVIRSPYRNAPGQSNILTYEISQAQNVALTIDSSADPITVGEHVTISGVLAGGSNTPVTLLARNVHQHGFAPVALAKTDAKGAYEFPAQSPVDSSLYEVQGGGRTSAVLYEGVKDSLTAIVLPGTSTQVGQTLTFSGTVSPEISGHVIYLEQQNNSGPGFHVVEVSTISGAGFAIEHTVYEAGTSVFRVRIPGDPQNGGALSQSFTITIAPAPSAAAIKPESPGNSTLPPEGQV
jgi:hypothetical protein